VDSIDDDAGHHMELFINPVHVVCVKVEKALSIEAVA
jgi:hypothetical protein